MVERRVGRRKQQTGCQTQKPQWSHSHPADGCAGVPTVNGRSVVSAESINRVESVTAALLGTVSSFVLHDLWFYNAPAVWKEPTENKQLRGEDVRTSRRSNEKWDSSVLFFLLLLRELCVVETFSPFQHIDQLFCSGFNVKMPPDCD